MAFRRKVHEQQWFAQGRRDSDRRAELRLSDKCFLPKRIRCEYAQHIRGVLDERYTEQRALEHLGTVNLGFVVVRHETRVIN